VKIQSEQPGITKEAAAVRVIENDPDLYQRFSEAAAVEARQPPPVQPAGGTGPKSVRDVVISRLFSEADALRARSPETLTRDQAVGKVFDAKPAYGIIDDRATEADLRK